jgi:hypothetical protein
MSDVSSVEPASTGRVMAPTRIGTTVKVEMTDQTHGGTAEGYITGNLGVDGKLREVFLHGFGKEGSTMDGWTQFCAVLLSLALQAGADFAGVARRVGVMKFAPYGSTTDPDIPWAPSIPAYIVCWLALRFGDEPEITAVREVMEEWS